LTIADLSAFVRALRMRLAPLKELAGCEAMLSHLAAAAGYRNWQHLVAVVEPTPAPAAPDSDLLRRAERAAHVFDAQGRMKHWPGQTLLQGLCLWVLWSRLPAGQNLSDPQINAVIEDWNLFGDHILLCRSLIGHRLVARSADKPGRSPHRTTPAARSAGADPACRGRSEALSPRLAFVAPERL